MTIKQNKFINFLNPRKGLIIYLWLFEKLPKGFTVSRERHVWSEVITVQGASNCGCGGDDPLLIMGWARSNLIRSRDEYITTNVCKRWGWCDFYPKMRCTEHRNRRSTVVLPSPRQDPIIHWRYHIPHDCDIITFCWGGDVCRQTAQDLLLFKHHTFKFSHPDSDGWFAPDDCATCDVKRPIMICDGTDRDMLERTMAC